MLGDLVVVTFFICSLTHEGAMLGVKSLFCSCQYGFIEGEQLAFAPSCQILLEFSVDNFNLKSLLLKFFKAVS